MPIDEPHDVPVHKKDVALTWVNVALGCWLMITPFLWSHSESAMANAFLTGAFVAWFSAAAMSQPTLRYVDASFGIWLAVSSVIFHRSQHATLINGLVVGGLVVIVSFLGSANVPTTARRPAYGS